MTKRSRIAVLLVPLALVAAACGSDDDSGSDTTDGATEATDAPDSTDDMTETTDDMTETTDGEEWAATVSLLPKRSSMRTSNRPPTSARRSRSTGCPSRRPSAGWSASCRRALAIGPGVVDAAAALGWEVVTIPASSGDQGPAIQQALDQGVDFLAHTGSPLATAEEQIAAAQDAGVGYYSCYSTDVPDPENNNLFIQCGDTEGVFATGNLISQWIIADSGGTANTLLVNIPDFPVLVSEAEGAAAAYEENCPDCNARDARHHARQPDRR